MAGLGIETNEEAGMDFSLLPLDGQRAKTGIMPERFSS
jgi:hypothetical protein